MSWLRNKKIIFNYTLFSGDLILNGSTIEVYNNMQSFYPLVYFQLENLFCLGSPLGVFLALRGIRPQGKGSLDHIIPGGACKRLFNIYHPADPVVSFLLSAWYTVLIHMSRYLGKQFQRKIVNIYLIISFNICFGCSKEPPLLFQIYLYR